LGEFRSKIEFLGSQHPSVIYSVANLQTTTPPTSLDQVSTFAHSTMTNSDKRGRSLSGLSMQWGKWQLLNVNCHWRRAT